MQRISQILGAGILALIPAGLMAESTDLNPTAGEIDAFLSADDDGDRELTRAEFEKFVQAMAAQGQPTAKQIRFFGAYGLAFKIADGDKNGRLTPAELRNADDNHRAAN